MEALLKFLLDQGSIGAVILVLGNAAQAVVIRLLWKALQDCQNLRLNEAKESTTAIEGTNRVGVAVAAAIESRNKVTESLDRTIAQLVREIEKLERDIDSLRTRT